jgi:hypothetical protein
MACAGCVVSRSVEQSGAGGLPATGSELTGLVGSVYTYKKPAKALISIGCFLGD